MNSFTIFDTIHISKGGSSMHLQTHTIQLQGSSYEVGYQLGKVIRSIPALKEKCIIEKNSLDLLAVKEEITLLDRWCPGLSAELQGTADALQVKVEQLYFLNMTYLIPRCSQIAVLPKASKDGKPLLARNYEYSAEIEDFCFIKTSIEGKYSHMGTSMLYSGRDDGCNEHGLAVTMSSCGMPVVDFPNMRQPKIKGLQYWVIIRAILENCKNVAEALDYIQDMPIAFNMNMIVLDKSGRVALVQTMDGRHAVRYEQNQAGVLFATNHSVLKELQKFEPQAFVHSIRRYKYINKQLTGKNNITSNELKTMLLAKYPNGLCLHNYKESFGTTKSLVISPVDGTIEICWGGNIENGWNIYSMQQTIPLASQDIYLNMEEMAAGIFDYEAL